MLLGSYSNPRQVFDRYEVLGFISSGTYGRVYKARYRDGRPGEFAIKKFKTDQDGEVNYTGLTQSAIREMSLCSELSHSNVVRTVEIILEDKSVYIVFEYAEHDLLQIIHHHSQLATRPPISVRMVKSIMFQLLQGVLYLHRSWVLHRDLKPANIMVSGHGSVKIGDLGLARIFRRPLATLYSGDKVVVTIWYRAPELLLGARHYTPAVDLWSVGCIFAELLSLRPIFKGEEAKMEGKKVLPFQRSQMQKILEVMGVPSVEDWPLLVHMPEYHSLHQLVQSLTQTAGSGRTPNASNLTSSAGVVDIRNVSLEKWYYNTLSRRYDLSPDEPAVSSNNNADIQNPDIHLGRHALSLLQRLLDFNPETRLTAEQALLHPFFTADAHFESTPTLQRNCFSALSSTTPHANIYPARKVSPDDLETRTVALQARQAQVQAQQVQVTAAQRQSQMVNPQVQRHGQVQASQARMLSSQMGRQTQAQTQAGGAAAASQHGLPVGAAGPGANLQGGQNQLRASVSVAQQQQQQYRQAGNAGVGTVAGVKRPQPDGPPAGSGNMSAASILDLAYQKAKRRRGG